ncbi:response regulator [Vibrio sp. CAU 1672]|uniref:response regulator n=1 Tax=Vibrio sp. CAU 1672 TaxID=3032594 RepID=UPI0023D97AAF|nr:response regulator [Vibrio sp. CAU 1672]
MTGNIRVDNINILVIDDSPSAVTLIKDQLVAIGADKTRITCAHTPAVALQAVKTRFFPLIILDYHLNSGMTGLDLLNLMSRTRLISDMTAVLMVSGDASLETVLTALSGRVRFMLTKPLQTKALQSKIMATLRAQQTLADVIANLRFYEHLTLDDILSIHEQHHGDISVEAALIDFLIKENHIDLLEALLPSCNGKTHASLVCAQAFLLHRQGKETQAITLLSDFVIQNPLCLRALDNLTGLYESLGQYNNAMSMAYRAFKLTPSNSSRMLTATRIANKLGQLDQLYKIGHCFACHLSPTDSQWLPSISTYVEYMIQHFDKMPSRQEKRTLLKKLNDFCLIVQQHLSESKQNDLHAFKQLIQCKLFIAESRFPQAHKKLLLGLSYYYKQPKRMPLTMIKQAIPLLDSFGEFAIKQSLTDLISNRLELPDTPPLNSVSTEVCYADRYPFSSELKLKFLASIDPQQSAPPEIKTTLESLAGCPLPPNWALWLNDFRSGHYPSQLPQPFDMAAT